MGFAIDGQVHEYARIVVHLLAICVRLEENECAYEEKRLNKRTMMVVELLKRTGSRQGS